MQSVTTIQVNKDVERPVHRNFIGSTWQRLLLNSAIMRIVPTRQNWGHTNMLCPGNEVRSSSTRSIFRTHLGVHRYLGPYPKLLLTGPAHELVVHVGLFRNAELLLLRIFFKNKKKMRLIICVLHATEQYLMFFK